jgi:hypothetical protein
MGPAPQFRHDGNGLRLGTAADGEGTCDRKALDSYVKHWKLAGSHFNVWRFLNLALAGRNQLWLVRGILDKVKPLNTGIPSDEDVARELRR